MSGEPEKLEATPVAGDATAAASPSPSPAVPAEASSATPPHADVLSPAVAAPAAPDNWREMLAGGDANELKRLERFKTPADWHKSYRELEKKLSSGQKDTPLPKDATPEQVAAWRKERGIPEKPEDYKIELPNGVVLGEADKPVVDSFTSFVHEQNWPTEYVNAGVAWYYQHQDAMRQAQEGADLADRNGLFETMQKEWDADFGANRNGIVNYAATNPFIENLFGARLPNGKLFMNDPDGMRWLNKIVEVQAPQARMVPAGAHDTRNATNSQELASIRKTLREDRRSYDRDPKMQARFGELLEWEQKQTGKAA